MIASYLAAERELLPGGPGYLSDHVGLRASLFLAPPSPASLAAAEHPEDLVGA